MRAILFPGVMLILSESFEFLHAMTFVNYNNLINILPYKCNPSETITPATSGNHTGRLQICRNSCKRGFVEVERHLALPILSSNIADGVVVGWTRYRVFSFPAHDNRACVTSFCSAHVCPPPSPSTHLRSAIGYLEPTVYFVCCDGIRAMWLLWVRETVFWPVNF